MERLTMKTPYGYESINPVDVCVNEYSEINFKGLVDSLGAYEDAEEQGLILRLPVAIGEMCWGWEYPTRIDEEDGSEWIICDIKRANVVPKKFNIFMLDKFGHCYFATKEEAEQALKQMGE